ncbi:MAG: hypothetical protein JWR51_4405 [Devosia sp.]|nr:hypothetical protein [Devosia sp.]
MGLENLYVGYGLGALVTTALSGQPSPTPVPSPRGGGRPSRSVVVTTGFEQAQALLAQPALGHVVVGVLAARADPETDGSTLDVEGFAQAIG